MTDPNYQIINYKDYWFIVVTANNFAVFAYIDENLNLSHVQKRFSTKEDAEETLAKYLFAQEHLKKLRENKL